MDLKVEELLKEVQLYSSTTRTVDQSVAAMKEIIKNIPDQIVTTQKKSFLSVRVLFSSLLILFLFLLSIQVTADAALGFIRDLHVPLKKAEFTFKKPKSFETVGSYSINSLAKPHINVDVLLPMPKECFHEKDYLDHRYHAKRCLYLCVIAKYLKLSSVVRRIEWSTFQHEARKPVLLVYPDVDLSEPFQAFVRLIPAATSLFNVSKLNPSRNNVRTLTQGNIRQATPKYNSSILEDMFLEENADYVKKAFLGWKDLREALLLMKVWARHRSSIYAHDGLNGFLIAIIMSFLVTESGGNRIMRSMKAMQIFRVTLDFIATSKLWDKGFSLQSSGQYNGSKEERRQHQQSFCVILCDISGHSNLAFRMTRSALKELQDEAAWTLNYLDKCKDGGFEEVFMTKADFATKFDYCIRINLKRNGKICEVGFCLDDECWRVYEEKVQSLLEQGLTDRANLVRVTWGSTPVEWNIEDGFSEFGNVPLLAGVMVSSTENSFRLVDVGPNSEHKEEVVNFRKFWGEKAELRRFKDGTIAESTVWLCQQWERHLIMKRIAEYILCQHLSLSNADMVHVADQLDFCLLHGAKDAISVSGDLNSAFELLSKRLRQLEDIPLRVSSVQPLDPAFRCTSVFPPEPHMLANEKDVGRSLQKFVTTCIEPLDVMIQLEGSGNWPLDEVAIKKTKSAFLLKIGECLESRWDMICIASEEEVDVLMSGYAFRLRILHERGMNSLKKQDGNGQMKWVPSLDKDLFLRGQHSSMINGLQGRYPTYGTVVRLAKRWVTSHLFSSYLAEEAIELLVAYLFLKPFPFHAPCSRITGFLRFLQLLSTHDWTFSPLIVDINNDLTFGDEKEIHENFISSRKSCGENAQKVDPAIFLATPYDKVSEAWTKVSPSTSVLRKMVAYARSSAEFLTKLISQGQNGAHMWECVFRTPLNKYDAVIVLHRDKLPYPKRVLFPAEMSKGRHMIQGKASKDFHPYIPIGNRYNNIMEVRDKLMVNFDPTRCFVGDLKREFSDTFSVWYDSLGGDAIGLTWQKSESKKRNREEAGNVEMLKDVGAVGKGFVKSIYLLKGPRVQS